MAYRTQKPKDTCATCTTLTDTCCLRCTKPLCADHMPANDERCETCEADWLVNIAPLKLNKWGRSSHALLGGAKWSAIVGLSALPTAMVLVYVWSALGIPIWTLLWLVGLMTLGFPLSLLFLAGIPAARSVERAIDKRDSDRGLFLAERHFPALPAAPEDC